MNIISRKIQWVLSIKNLYNSKYTKISLLYTNIIFIIVIFVILNYKNNIYKNRTKYYTSLLLLFLMGVFSYKYHDCQCYSNNKNKILKWQKADIVLSIILAITFFTLYFKNINFYVLSLSGIALFLFLSPPANNDIIYIISHSLWHILVGVISYLLIIND